MNKGEKLYEILNKKGLLKLLEYASGVLEDPNCPEDTKKKIIEDIEYNYAKLGTYLLYSYMTNSLPTNTINEWEQVLLKRGGQAEELPSKPPQVIENIDEYYKERREDLKAAIAKSQAPKESIETTFSVVEEGQPENIEEANSVIVPETKKEPEEPMQEQISSEEKAPAPLSESIPDIVVTPQVENLAKEEVKPELTSSSIKEPTIYKEEFMPYVEEDNSKTNTVNTVVTATASPMPEAEPPALAPVANEKIQSMSETEPSTVAPVIDENIQPISEAGPSVVEENVKPLTKVRVPEGVVPQQASGANNWVADRAEPRILANQVPEAQDKGL